MTTTAPTLESSRHPGAGSTTRATRRASRTLGCALDALAVVALGAVLLHFAARDGGVGVSSWHLAGVAALSLLPALREVARVPAPAQAVVAAWAVAALSAVVFAVDRSDVVRPTLVYALMPLAALTTCRLLRRPWGRTALVGLLVVSLGLYWHRSILQWWGYTLGGGEARWLSLSWHNQSATLMGAFGVFFLALALTSRRVLSAVAGLLATAALAGAWLAGSRGAVVAVGLGAVAAVWVGGRWQGWRRTAAVAAAVLLATLGLVGALLAMGEGTERITSGQPATTNLMARFHHMEAAVGMLADRPLAGYGLGSYGTSARAHSSPDMHLTSSPHNEFLAPFAEGGLPFGLAVLAGAVLLGGVVWRVLTSPAPAGVGAGDVREQLASASVAAAAAATVVLGTHALVDFDWRYPVLAVALCVSGALAWRPSSAAARPSVDPRPGTSSAWRPGLARAGAVGLAVLLAVGLAGAWTERPGRADNAPWDALGIAHTAVGLLRAGDADEAAAAIARTRPWNPGLSELRGLALVADVERGTRSPEALVGALDSYPTRLGLRMLAAELLIDRGELLVAADLLEEDLALHHEYRGWRVEDAVARIWELRIDVAASRDGCEAALPLARRAARDDVLAGVERVAKHFHAHARSACGAAGG